MSNKNQIKRQRRLDRQQQPSLLKPRAAPSLLEQRDGSKVVSNGSGGLAGYVNPDRQTYLSQTDPMFGRFAGMTGEEILRAVAVENARAAPSHRSAVVPAEPWRARAPITPRSNRTFTPAPRISYQEAHTEDATCRIEESHLLDRMQIARHAGRTTLTIDELAGLLAAGHRQVSVSRLQRGYMKR